MRPPRVLRPLRLAVAAAIGLLMALTVVGQVPQAAAAGKRSASADYPRMPAHCATRAEKIPQRPVLCAMTRIDRSRPTVLLWGDSHAWMMLPALRAEARAQRVNLVASLMGSCPPVDPRATAGMAGPSSCAQSNGIAMDFVRSMKRQRLPLRIVLGASWERYLTAKRRGDRSSLVGLAGHRIAKGTPRLAARLRSLGVPADVVGQAATVPAKPRACGRRHPYTCALPRKRALPHERRTAAWVGRVARSLPSGARVIEVNAGFCGASRCRGRVDGIFTWYDDFHLSASRASRLRAQFAPTVAAAGGVRHQRS